MATYIISYDKRGDDDYSGLYKAIKSYPNKRRPLRSVWVIVSDYSAESIHNHLAEHLDDNDGLLVAKIYKPARWSGLDPEISQWLEDNVPHPSP